MIVKYQICIKVYKNRQWLINLPFIQHNSNKEIIYIRNCIRAKNSDYLV